MSGHQYPIVSGDFSIGEAARAATRASCSAVVVPTSDGYSLVNVADETIHPGARLGEITGSFGSTIDGSVEVMGAMASIHGPDIDFDRLDVAAGYKECTVNASHVYPASYPGSTCPQSDGGALTLVMF